ncbi:MAG: hypothetical protein HY867_07720 [Chloroflexi bacterium]|nr:hypothetical protein [Chloroflexota bacterium]
MRKSISILIIAMFLLSACGTQAVVDSSATPVPVPTSTIVRFTRTPGISPSRTPMQQEPTDQPSRTPQPTATDFPTSPAWATLVSLGEKFPELKSAWRKEISPDGHWAAFSDYTKNGGILHLIEINGGQRWDITYYEHSINVCRPDCGAQMGSVGIDHWSKNKTHLYVIPYPEWDGPGLWFTTGGATLIRFNLTDGSWVDMNIGESWSFSEDEGYLVYFAQEKPEIRLRSLLYDSEYVIRLPEKFESLGRFVWSPDNTQFAFTATYGEWYDGKIGFSSYVFDTKDLSLRTLFEDDLRFLYTVAWTENEKITLNQFNEENVYYYDLTTNEIIPAP